MGDREDVVRNAVRPFCESFFKNINYVSAINVLTALVRNTFQRGVVSRRYVFKHCLSAVRVHRSKVLFGWLVFSNDVIPVGVHCNQRNRKSGR